MTALAAKFRDFWSDLALEFELRFGGLFKKKQKPVLPSKITPVPSAPVINSAAASAPTPAASIPPATPASPPLSPPTARAVSMPVNKSFVAALPAKPAAKEKSKTEKLSFSLRMLRLSNKGRLFFFDQLSTLVGSGVPLIDSLNIIRAQTKNKSLQAMYSEMIHRINTGVGLSEAMAVFPHLFPSMQIALMEAAEKSGNLKVVLAEIVDDMETNQDFLRKVKGAMFYPVVLLILACGMVAGMMVFVIPKVAKMYGQAKVKLPALTQFIIDLSGLIREQWIFLAAGIFGGLFGLFLLFTKTRAGQMIWENLVTAFPVFGTISKEKNLMIIAGNMAMLLQSGVLISDAFQIVQKTVGNLHYERALAQVQHDVVMGKPISESMGLKSIESKSFKEHKLFPLQFAQLVRLGETTGSISQMLAKLRDNYKKSIDYKLKNISVIIEPLMIFLVAGIVGSILLAVMMPFFYIGTTIK